MRRKQSTGLKSEHTKYCLRQYESNFNQFDVIGLGPSLSYEAAQFGEITQNNGQYAVQGYSRSLISEPLESPYATS